MTLLSPVALLAASCQAAPIEDKRTGATKPGATKPADSEADSGDARAAAADSAAPFDVTVAGQFDEPWAMAFLPGGRTALVTERKGRLKLWHADGAMQGRAEGVTGTPTVAYAGQGGLGDIALAPDFVRTGIVYLSWVEAGGGDTRGAVVGRATLVQGPAPRLDGLHVIWRQQPKVTGAGHFSHRLAFSPDGRYLFVASGERQKFTPAQDLTVNLGKIVRLLPDGTPAPGNPFAARAGPTAATAGQIWSYGHRNVLGLQFDAAGRLWEIEHGPKGGDELNLVEPGRNYGWPLVSDGDNYDGTPIPRNATRPDLARPAISWNPVIAPGDFIFYAGDAFPQWRGQALIAAMKPGALVRVAIDGDTAREVARYTMPHRIREIREGAGGELWLLEDGKERGAGRLLRLTPRTARVD